jgi:hypothetical protein
MNKPVMAPQLPTLPPLSSSRSGADFHRPASFGSSISSTSSHSKR